MSGITPANLDSEVRAILDTAAWDGASEHDQPVCRPDGRVTAQLSGGDPPPESLTRPWRIANAFAGDLIMSPGGPSGMIGGLLSQLDPPQHYSHMAVVTGDHVQVRHATAVADRVAQFYEGSILGIQRAPTDGIKEDALRHQWPGTVTQTVELAYLSWRDHPILRDPDNEPILDDNGATIPLPGYGFKDAATGSSYLIDALSFSPVPISGDDDRDRLLWPLVVTSCPQLTSTEVIEARRRIADAARDIRGHYRLFAYSQAAIAIDPAYDGPPSYETEMRDPSCEGSGGRVPVDRTQALVCSTLPWAALQLANERGGAAGLPHIVIDGRPADPEISTGHAVLCDESAFRRRDKSVDRTDASTPDGLYHYDEGEREHAARWLHDVYMVPSIEAHVETALPNVWSDLGVVGGLGVSAFLSMLVALPITTVGTVLGVAPGVLADLIILCSDMPDDVANQLCNAFASDDCSQAAIDSDAWTSPGEGRSVSPDNIVRSWAAPTPADGILHGLYGWNDRIRLRPPELVANPVPAVSWQISQGFGSMEGQVFYRDDSGARVGVPGAHVRIGATHLSTDAGGSMFHPRLPSGGYWCVASATDGATGLVLDSRGEAVDIPDGGGLGLDIEVFAPPESRREVLITGHMDLVNRYAIGKDWWGHPRFAAGPSYVGLDYWPDEPQYAAQRTASIKHTDSTSSKVDDWGSCNVQWEIEVQDDFSVKVAWRARLAEDPDDPWQANGDIIVSPGASERVTLDMVRSEMAWPVRGHVEFEVMNNAAP